MGLIALNFLFFFGTWDGQREQEQKNKKEVTERRGWKREGGTPRWESETDYTNTTTTTTTTRTTMMMVRVKARVKGRGRTRGRAQALKGEVEKGESL